MAVLSLIDMNCQLPSLPDPYYSFYEQYTLGMIMMTTTTTHTYAYEQKSKFPLVFHILKTLDKIKERKKCHQIQ